MIDDANVNQDTWGFGGNLWKPEYHFDREVTESPHTVAFNRGRDYVLLELDIIKKKTDEFVNATDDAARKAARTEVLQAMGRMFHAIQDLASTRHLRQGERIIAATPIGENDGVKLGNTVLVLKRL